MRYEKKCRDYYNVDLKKLEESLTVYRYHSFEPIFIIDFAGENDLYNQFISGTNIDQVNTMLCTLDQITNIPKSTYKVNKDILCVAIIHASISLTIVNADYVYIDGRKQQALCSIHSINLLRSINYQDAPLWFFYIPKDFSYELFNISCVQNKRMKHQIYSLAHNFYIIDSKLYLSVYFSEQKYLAKDLSIYLASITDLFEVLCDLSSHQVFSQIDIHSPGNIIFVIENAISFLKENWSGLLIIFLLIFGGKFATDKITIEIPSIKNFIAFFLNLKYNLKIKQLEVEEKKEGVTAQKLTNQKTFLDNIEQASSIIEERGEQIVELSQKMKIIMSNDDAPNLQEILDILETPIDNE